jgi:hypothetical protein
MGSMLAFGGCAIAIAACASNETGGTSGTGATAEAGANDSGDVDSGSPGEGGSVADSGDAGIIDGPGKPGDECSFNRECNAALRCECTESAGCACKAGVRGTGRNGIDPCNDGNACASAVCVEGPPDSGSFCSDECATSNDCKGQLPLCSTIAFVGRICIRTPPK